MDEQKKDIDTNEVQGTEISEAAEKAEEVSAS